MISSLGVEIEFWLQPHLHDCLEIFYQHGKWEVVLVSDAGIRRAQQALWDGARIVAEAGGAAAFAALQSGAYRPGPGERVGVIVSGGNTTAVDFDGSGPPSAAMPRA